MHALEISAACAAAVVLVVIVLVIARQRFMLRAPGTVPLALRARSPRWQFGVGRFVEGELRWYRSLGLGTRPNRVLRRGELTLVSRRDAVPAERGTLPPRAVVVELRDDGGEVTLAFADGTYPGFVSWLESAPLS